MLTSLPPLKATSHDVFFAGKVDQIRQLVLIAILDLLVLRPAGGKCVLHNDRRSIAKWIRVAVILSPYEVHVMDSSLGKDGDFPEIDNIVLCLGVGGALRQDE